ncbi:restriction endonuclease subunit S [Microvirga solisilvae]|uniref:restriction endonuclease subunit S n=1 Tax=Microvirga solisilvae TaxID=2919498 RepID=UPI001FAFBCD5|nr:restriction endonuclease subunit S [Microvirga solisilvae]
MSGEKPDGWRVGSLGDLILLEYGKSLPEAKRVPGPFPVYGSSGIVGFNERALVSAPGIIIGRKGTVGSVIFADSDFWPIDTTYFVSRRGDFDLRWIYYLLQHVDLAQLNEATGVPGLNRDKAAKVSVVIPPLSEQRRIAEVLSSVDEAIQAAQAVIEQTRKVKQGVLTRLLTKGVGHTRFKQTEIGEIPEEWEALSLEHCGVSIIDGDRGKEYPKAADYSDTGHCLFLSAQNVTKRGFSFDTAQFISRERHEKLRKGVVERGDVVITTRGTVGNLAYYDQSIPHDLMRINSGMAILRTDGRKVYPRYLYAALTSPVVEKQIEKLTFGSAQPQLTIKIIKGLVIPVPSGEEQELVARRCAELAQAVQEGEQHLAALHSFKSALMADLLTGRKRVFTDLPMAAE